MENPATLKKPQSNYNYTGSPEQQAQLQGNGPYGGSFGKNRWPSGNNNNNNNAGYSQDTRQDDRMRYKSEQEEDDRMGTAVQDEQHLDIQQQQYQENEAEQQSQQQKQLQEQESHEGNDNEEEKQQYNEGEYETEENADNNQDDNEEEEEDEEQELVCVKCEQQVEEALILKCKHKLCLNCAASQYSHSLANLSDETQLPDTVQCDLCPLIPTPLAENSIQVLLRLAQQQANEFHEQQQQQEDEEQDIKYQQYQQQFQQQQQQQQQNSIPESTQQSLHSLQNQYSHDHSQLYSNQQQATPYGSQISSQQQHQQQQQQQYFNQQQQPISSQSQNEQYSQQLQSQQQQHQNQSQSYQPINPASTTTPISVSTAEAAAYLQKNPFHQNIIDAKNKKKLQSQEDTRRFNSISPNTDESPILYCFSCETPCFSLEDYLKGLHKNHNVKNVTKAFTELQEPIDDLRLKIKAKGELLLQDEGRLIKKREELMDVLNRCKESIQDQFNEIFSELQRKQKELIQQAEDTIQEKNQEIENGRNKIKDNLQKLELLDNDLDQVYYKCNRNLSNDIRAFNHFSENKTKIIEIVHAIDTDVLSSVRSKLAYEFNLDTNSLKSHIDSVKAVKLEITQLQGLLHSDYASPKMKFYQNSNNTENSTKQLLNHIISQQSQSQSQQQPSSSISDELGILNNNLQSQTNPPSSSAAFINNILKRNSSTSSFSGNQPQLGQQQNAFAAFLIPPVAVPAAKSERQSSAVSPGRYIKIQPNGCLDQGTQSRRFPSPRQQQQQASQSQSQSSFRNAASPTIEKQRQQARDLQDLNRLQSQPQFLQQQQQIPGFKSFSINAKSARQEFSNILQGNSDYAKKYTHNPQVDIFEQQSPSLAYLSQQQQSLGVPNSFRGTSTSSQASKAQILEQLDSFKRNVEELRRQKFGTDENYNGLNNNNINNLPPTADQKASFAIQSRIKQLEEKLASKAS